MKKIDKRAKKYLGVWDSILEWIESRISQKDELSTAEVKHIAEIQEKIQKSQGIILNPEDFECRSSVEILSDMIDRSRKKYKPKR